MAKFDVKITSNIPEILTATKEAIQKAYEAVGLQGEGYAKMLCPVDTGNLRNSITHFTADDGAYIGTNVEYAPYVEFGTSKTPAQPFLEPAATEHSDEYVEIFREFLKDA